MLLLRCLVLVVALVGLSACTDDGSSSGEADAGSAEADADRNGDANDRDRGYLGYCELDDDDCDPGQVCNFGQGVCAFECQDEGDCLADEECVDRGDGAQFCYSFPSSDEDPCREECDDSQLCDFVTEECAQSCSHSDECGYGEACYERVDADGNVCALNPCDKDGDCLDGWLCDLDDTRLCLSECDEESDCPDEHSCIERQSEPGKLCKLEAE